MAKEFQLYSRKYAKLAGTALKTILTQENTPDDDRVRDVINGITEWPYMHHFTETYSISLIHYAVYEAPDTEEWQKFRVSLKGLSTREKLFCLGWYWDYHVSPSILRTYTVRFELIRVNNYLGALKRSGHLDSNLKVVK